MKAILIKCCVLLALLAMAASGASAVVGYVNPPTTFVPQRTMFWTFDNQQSWQTPITDVGPTWDTNTEQWGDWTCDQVTPSGGLQWYPTNSAWQNRQGMIGLDNRDNQSPGSGSLTIHINNFSTQNPLKYIWLEVEVAQWGLVNSDGVITSPNTTIDMVANTQTPLADGSMRFNQLWEIRPNPPSFEEFTWTFQVPANGGILVDKFFISTACVPEPSALLALGSGVIGLIGFASKKRRA